MLKALAAKHKSSVAKTPATSQGHHRPRPQDLLRSRAAPPGQADLVARIGGIPLRQDRRAVIHDPAPTQNGHQALSWRRSSGERRQQLKWLLSGAAVCLSCLTVSTALGSASGIWETLGNVVLAGVLALPIGIGVGILKYRLYEIDRIISRTLAYAMVSCLLAGVYAGLVLLATQVLEIRTPDVVAGATLAVAALFNLLRQRVQRAVDHRFNRARYDADQAIAAFAARLQDAVDPDAVHADLLAAVHHALEPTHASVWIRQ